MSRQLFFNTDALAPEDRADAWRDLLAPHDIQLGPGDVRSRVSAVMLDRMIVRRLDATPLSINRTRNLIRRDGLEHIILHLTSDCFVADADGQHRAVEPHVITLNDMSQPLRRSMAGEAGSIAVTLARELVEEAISSADGLHGLQLHGAENALLASHLRSLAEWAPSAQEADAAAMARATSLVMAAAVRPSRQTLGAAREGVEIARLAQARRYVERHLDDRNLSPETIAKALQVSRATLFNLFKPIDGVAGYIRNRRLAKAYRLLLANPARGQVAQIAHQLGFTSVSHFNRIFKEVYGLTPGEVQSGHSIDVNPAVELEYELLRRWTYAIG